MTVETVRSRSLFVGLVADLATKGADPFAQFIDENGVKYEQSGNSALGVNGWQPVSSDGTSYIADVGLISQRHNRYETGIGYVAGLTGEATFTQPENVRRYRCKASAAMRVVEDAVNEAQAEAWLNTGNPRAASPDTDVEYLDLVADVWSEWQELSKDPNDLSLSNLWFSLDAAGTDATSVVEAE